MKKILTVLLAIFVLFSLSISALAVGNNTNVTEALPGPSNFVAERPSVVPNNSEKINGSSTQSIAPAAASTVQTYFVTSATQVTITVSNIGNNFIDTYYGSVIIGNRSVPFQIYSLVANTTRVIPVNIDMLLCQEDITVQWYITDEGLTYGPGVTTGSRSIPIGLANYWVSGSYTSIYHSINDHFYRHGAQAGCTNIVAYATLAAYYRDQVVYDVQHLTSTQLAQKYAITTSNGHTPSHNYVVRSNSMFILLSDAGMNIVTFGRN